MRRVLFALLAAMVAGGIAFAALNAVALALT
jgi:hypothetical protein